MRIQLHKLMLQVSLLMLVLVGGTVLSHAVQLTIYSNFPPGTEEYERFQEYLRRYEALNPGVQIEDLGRETAAEKLAVMLASGTAPDLIGFTTHYVFTFYEQGYIADPPEHIVAQMHEHLLPVTIQANTLRGKVIGLPSQNNVTTMFYNHRIMSESGLAPVPPSTWEELTEMSIKTTTPERAGLVTSRDAWSLTRFGIAMLWSMGGDVFDANGEVVLDGAPFRQVLDYFVEAFRPESYGVFGYSRVFNNSEATFGLGIPSHLSDLRRANPNYAEETAAAPLPAGPAGSRANHYGHTYAVVKGPNEEETWKLLEWLFFSDEGLNGLTPMGDANLQRGYPPYHRSDIAYAVSEHPDAMFYKGFIDTLMVARNYEQWWEYGITSLLVGNAIRDAVDGKPLSHVIETTVEDLRRQILEASGS